MFSTIEAKPHAERKRMLSHVYSKSHVNTSPELNDIVDTATANVKTELLFYANANRALDFYKLTKSFGMDVTSAYIFGPGRGTNFIQKSRNTDPLEAFEIGVSPDVLFYTTAFYATGLSKVIGWMEGMGITPLGSNVLESWQSMEDMCLGMCEKAKKNMFSGSFDEEKRNGGSYPTVYAELYNKLRESGVPAEKLDKTVAAELLDHMLAGNELIGETLCYLMWELSIHPEMHHQLQEEIKTCLVTPRLESSSLPSAQIIDGLPVLDAVLQETLRLHPGSFGPFPRVVPPNGAQIDGIEVPGGTVISTSAYSLHQNATVFSQPDQWLPERWIDASEEKNREMLRWFWVFGSGGRMCIGNHLAIRSKRCFLPFGLCM